MDKAALATIASHIQAIKEARQGCNRALMFLRGHRGTGKSHILGEACEAILHEGEQAGATAHPCVGIDHGHLWDQDRLQHTISGLLTAPRAAVVVVAYNPTRYPEGVRVSADHVSDCSTRTLSLDHPPLGADRHVARILSAMYKVTRDKFEDVQDFLRSDAASKQLYQALGVMCKVQARRSRVHVWPSHLQAEEKQRDAHDTIRQQLHMGGSARARALSCTADTSVCNKHRRCAVAYEHNVIHHRQWVMSPRTYRLKRVCVSGSDKGHVTISGKAYPLSGRRIPYVDASHISGDMLDCLQTGGTPLTLHGYDDPSSNPQHVFAALHATDSIQAVDFTDFPACVFHCCQGP